MTNNQVIRDRIRFTFSIVISALGWTALFAGAGAVLFLLSALVEMVR